MTLPGWEACLDGFAAHLEQQRTLLADDMPELLEAFVPEADLGPLPRSLVHRARALQQEADALTHDLSARLDANARQSQLVAVLHQGERERSSFVDSRC